MLVEIKGVYDDLDYHISSAPCNLQHILEAADGSNVNVDMIAPRCKSTMKRHPSVEIEDVSNDLDY
jgi:hypothetical protein